MLCDLCADKDTKKNIITFPHPYGADHQHDKEHREGDDIENTNAPHLGFKIRFSLKVSLQPTRFHFT